jgi:hypothetical protein
MNPIQVCLKKIKQFDEIYQIAEDLTRKEKGHMFELFIQTGSAPQ